MKKKTVVWLVIATALVLIGAAIFSGVMMTLGWDFTKLSTVSYETNEYTITDNYRDIKIVTDTADVVFIPAETVTTSVVCYESKRVTHTVMTLEDALLIEVNDTRKWYEYIGLFVDTPSITVYMPQGEYGTLSVSSSTGDVTIPRELAFESIDVAVSTGHVTNAASASTGITIAASTGSIGIDKVSVGSLRLSTSTGRVTVTDATCAGDVSVAVSTGKTQLTNITCQTLSTVGDTGDVTMQNVIAQGRIDIERSTGDVRFDGCDAAIIEVETDTGDVKGSFLTDKVFTAETDTGRVDVPQSITGGRCDIETDTGDIVITIDRHALV